MAKKSLKRLKIIMKLMVEDRGFEKIPLYLSWAGVDVTDELVDKFCNLFSKSVVQSVIESPWVPGVYEYIRVHHQQVFCTCYRDTSG